MTTEEELRQWLNRVPEEAYPQLAVRAALRCVPALVRSAADRFDELALKTFRLLVSSHVIVCRPDDSLIPSIRISELDSFSADGDAAQAAFCAAESAFRLVNSDLVISGEPVKIGGQSIIFVDPFASTLSTFLFAIDALVEPRAFLREARDEAPLSRRQIADRPLWLRNPFVPESLSELNKKLTGISWSFWSRWYDRAMAGDPLPWDLQREVALIPDEIWEKGPAAVAERIAEIEAAYLARTTQLAEEVTLDPETGTFSVTPRPLENAPLISALLARTEDALDDALHGQNGLREDMRPVRTLRRTHQRYGNDPQRIELDYTSVAITLRREIRETQELAETEDNLALLEAVEEGALAIRAQHPEIAENRQRIAQQKLREMDRADLEVLEAAEPVLVALSEGEMAEDFARDIPQLINDATTPLPTGAPPLPGVDESMRVFHRVSRIKVLSDAEADKGASVIEKRKAEIMAAVERKAKQFDSAPVKAARLGFFVKDVLEVIWKVIEIGLKLFGVL